MRSDSAPLTGTLVLSVALVSACNAPNDLDLVGKGGPPFEIVAAALPDGVTGVPYTAEIATVNGSGENYRWRVIAGVVPPGLDLFIEGTPSTTLSGTPTLGTHGAYVFRVEVTDSDGRRAEAVFEVSTLDETLPLEIAPRELGDATAELPYSTMVLARGGVGDYTWRVSGGALPAGLELGDPRPDDFVEIRGTPTMPGPHEFVLEVRDDVQTATASFELEVLPPRPPLRITTEMLPSASDGMAYTTTIAATGGTGGNYTWSVVAGAVVGGLTLQGAGTPWTRLSGIVQGFGRFEFTIRVEDAAGNFDERAFVLDVVETFDPIAIVGVVNGVVRLPDAVGGSVYVAQLVARDGQGDYTWSVTADALPPGLEMATMGTPSTTITGLPLAGGTFVATVTVTDESAGSDSARVSITVLPPPTLPTIHTSFLPDAVICDSYSVWIEASGGANAGYEWTVVAGTLPPGFTLTPISTPRGRVYGGTGAVSGSYDFTVQVTDPFGLTDTQAFSIAVADTYGGQRWVAAVGDLVTFTKNEIWIEDVCTSTAALPIRVTPATSPRSGDAFTGPFQAAFSPDGRAFAFIGDMTVNERDDVYIVDLRTQTPGPPVRVTEALTLGGNAGARELVWSNDGSKLAFAADADIVDVYDIYIVDVSNPAVPGSAVRASHLTTAQSNILPRPNYRFSPDGTKLAYAADLAVGDRRLWFVDLSAFPNGGSPGVPQVVHNTPPGSSDLRGAFQFTKDSRAIVYTGNFAVSTLMELWWVDVTGPTLGTPRSLGAGLLGCLQNGGTPYGWTISRDGTQLSARCGLGLAQPVIYLSDLSGTVPTGLKRAYGPTPNAGHRVDFAWWSPTGNAIALSGDLGTASIQEVFLLDLTSTSTPTPQPLMPQPPVAGRESQIQNPYDFGFSLDGSKFAFIADLDIRGSNELYFVNLREGPPFSTVRLNTPTTSSSERVVSFQFSPDSNKVALSMRFGSPSLQELFVVDVSGPTPGPMRRVHPVLPSGRGVSSTTSWMNFWDWFWTADSRELVFYGDFNPAATSATEGWITNVTGAPPFVARRWTPPTGNSHDVDWLYGQGNYSRRIETWE